MKNKDRTTLNIDRAALARAAALTGVKEKTTLVRMGLQALIARASAERLAALVTNEPWEMPHEGFRLARTLE